jgi:hypothetical protein
MVLILPSETRVNLDQVCSYFYKSGRLSTHLSSGVTYEEPMDVDKASKILVALDKFYDGPYYVNPPPPQPKKKNERNSNSPGVGSKPAGRHQVNSDQQGVERPG